ncbi:hypothetical protein [Persicitalea jodogahamensis]|nr:hypothetical protein [Persicitalea jodogahamensis]
MKKILSKIVLLLVLFVLSAGQLWAQCAMCRGSVESTMGNGRNNVGIGLNTGIMYLFIMPYLIVALFAYFWFKNSRKAREQQRMVAARVQQAMGS